MTDMPTRDIISHRGNVNGPVPELENSPKYIDSAIKSGFVVEVDLWLKNGNLSLGHDGPQYDVTLDWLYHRYQHLIIHIKDPKVLTETQVWHRFHCFCHSSDPFTMTNRAIMWIHDLSLKYTQDSIIPIISLDQVLLYNQGCRKTEGHICTDYPYMFE